MKNSIFKQLFDTRNCFQQQPLVIIISGPSGVGKDATVTEMKKLGMRFHYAVTATTRKPRHGELDGVHYHFVSEDIFKDMIKEKQLLEWACVYNSYYGVPLSELRKAFSEGQDVILKIDVQGATTVRQLLPDAVTIFLLPPSIDELSERLKRRDKQKGSNHELRIQKAEMEMNQKCLFDYIVMNNPGQLELTALRVNAIIIAEKHKSRSRSFPI